MNKTLKVSIVIIAILLISILFGVIVDKIGGAVDKKGNPQEFSEFVSKYSNEYGVPEYIIYAIIELESDFTSNAVSSAGAVGLMQIMPSTFEWMTKNLLGENLKKGMLYDPETNIKYGTYLLSYLYARYGNWDTTFAAYAKGVGTVDAWLENKDYVDENGVLVVIPDEEYVKYLDKLHKKIETYKNLYYQK